VSIDGTARPDIDVNDLKSKLKGMKLKEAENMLSSLQNIDGYELYYRPEWVPSFLKRMPRNSKNILIYIE